jgi:glutaredoxin
MNPVLTLYSRFHCHLCQDMLSLLQERQAEFGFQLEVVDIDSDPELVKRYGEKVPVLVRDAQEICHYYLDEAALKACLVTG